MYVLWSRAKLHSWEGWEQAVGKPEGVLPWGRVMCVLCHLTDKLMDSFRLYNFSPSVRAVTQKYPSKIHGVGGKAETRVFPPFFAWLGQQHFWQQCLSCKALVPRSSPLMPQLPPGGPTLGSETTPYLSAIASFQSVSQSGLSSPSPCVTTSLC